MLAEVGLAEAATRCIGGFSLGMKQRLGIAAALLGDPPVLIFDEPVNGMDPEGVLWMRRLFRRLAAEGRTVFLSSHLMSEMENTADQLVVIGQGLPSPPSRYGSSRPAAPASASWWAPRRPPNWQRR